MRNKTCLFFFLLGVLFFSSVNVFSDPRIAEIYFGFAEDLYRTGRHEDALELLDIALQFNPAYSDALLLKGHILKTKKEYRLEASEIARRALVFDTWTNFTPDDGRLFLARLLWETRRFEEALLLLEETGAGKRIDPEYALVKILCYFGINDAPRASAEVQRAMTTFPGDYRFLDLYFRVKDRIDPGDYDRLTNRKRGDSGYLSAFLTFTELSKNPEEKLLLGREYYELGGTDPRASCILIENGTGSEEKEIDRFLSFGGLSRFHLVRRVYKALKGPDLDYFEENLNKYSGVSYSDEDFDGLTEHSFFIHEGIVTEWRMDLNQDGNDEITAGFDKGGLRTLSLCDGIALMTITFSRYPSVETFFYRRDQEIKEYFIVPGRFNFSAFKSPPENHELSTFIQTMPNDIDKKSFVIPLFEIKNSSYQIIEKRTSSADYFLYRLSAGIVQTLEEIVHREGKDGVRRKLFFQNEKPVRGERDLNGDGAFEIIESYRNGVLHTIEADLSGDGKPEYRESALANAVKEWDFNGDGKIDAREYRVGKNQVKREYASFWDGIFDSSSVDVRRLDQPVFSMIEGNK